MVDYPDIYADGYGVGWGDLGFTVTLFLSQPPTTSTGAAGEPIVVARIRMSPQFAAAFAEQLRQAVASHAAQQPPQGGDGRKN